MVMVRTVREPCRPTGFVKGRLAWQPRLPPETVGGNRATRAVHVVVEVLVGLELAKVGQQLLKTPLVVAHGGPRVIVFGHAAQEDLAVDGARATRHLAARHQYLRRLVGASPDELPVVAAG